MTDNQTHRPPSNGDVLTLGFGTTVAMWTAGYITHLPNTPPPPIVLLLIVMAIMLAGGFLLRPPLQSHVARRSGVRRTRRRP